MRSPRLLALATLATTTLVATPAPDGSSPLPENKVNGVLQPPPATERPELLAQALAGPLRETRHLVFATCENRGSPWYSTYGYRVAGKFGGPADFAEFEQGRREPLVDLAKPKRGSLRLLDLHTGSVATLLDEPDGGIRDPFVDWDGKRVVFSRFRAGETRWHIWEIQTDGTGLRQLTSGDDDTIEPMILANGDLLFTSTALHRTVPCAWTQVATLHRRFADGTIRPISAGIEVNRHPWPLPDGRVVFTRWEYTHRNATSFMQLFAVNPDGTRQQALFGNSPDPAYPNIHNAHFPEAKPIPGTRSLIAIYAPEHHSAEGTGYLCKIDLSGGPDNWAGLRIITGYDETKTYPGPAQVPNHERFRRLVQKQVGMGSPDLYRDPYPVVDGLYFVTRRDQILLMDDTGAYAVVYRDPQGRVVNEPRLVQAADNAPAPAARVASTR